MDQSSRKRRGFIKGKLMPLYKVTKPSSSPTVQYNMMSSSKVVKPSQSSPETGYVVPQQDYVVAHQPKQQKVSFVTVATAAAAAAGLHHQEQQKQSHFKRRLFGDDIVDVKAASYISSVQERFKLERLNSERFTS